jgi:hypothetical protein
MTITEFIEKLKGFGDETEVMFSMFDMHYNQFFNTNSVHINYCKDGREYKCVLFAYSGANDPSLTVKELTDQLTAFKEKHGDIEIDIWYDTGFEQYYPGETIRFLKFQTGVEKCDICNKMTFKLSIMIDDDF